MEFKSVTIKGNLKIAAAIEKYLETRRENTKKIIEKYRSGEYKIE